MSSRYTLVNSITLATAEAINVKEKVGPIPNVAGITVEATFVRAGGGTTTKCYIQTSLDGGVTWTDIMCFAFATTTQRRLMAVGKAVVATPATPTDGTLADNTSLNGILGDMFQAKVVTTGDYTGASSLKVNMNVEG